MADTDGPKTKMLKTMASTNGSRSVPWWAALLVGVGGAGAGGGGLAAFVKGDGEAIQRMEDSVKETADAMHQVKAQLVELKVVVEQQGERRDERVGDIAEDIKDHEQRLRALERRAQ